MASDVAQEVASVMEKIAAVSDASPGRNIYIAEQRTALEEARSCIERLLVEYGKLQLDRDATQQEAYASTEFYEEELKKRKNYIHELELKAEQREKEFIKQQKEWQERVQMINSAAQKEKGELMTKLFSVQDELASLQSFRTQLAEIQSQLENAKGELAEQLEKDQHNLAELERKYLEQTNNLKREHERSVEQMRNELETEIEERVKTRIMHIVKDNEQLKEELQLHVEETNTLQKDRSILQSENAALSRELELLRQAESLHLQKNTNQTRSIAENVSKIQKLEKTLIEVIREYSAERRALEEDHQKLITSKEIEKQALKLLVQTKMKELKKVRHLAQQFLQERGEVESFLVESIQYITEQVKNEKRAQKSQVQIGHLHSQNSTPPQEYKVNSNAPFARPTNSSSQKQYNKGKSGLVPHRRPSVGGKCKQKACADNQLDIFEQLEEIPVKLAPKVDISELTWEEREKVLRYLFQKINSANQLPNSVPKEGYELLYGSE